MLAYPKALELFAFCNYFCFIVIISNCFTDTCCPPPHADRSIRPCRGLSGRALHKTQDAERCPMCPLRCACATARRPFLCPMLSCTCSALLLVVFRSQKKTKICFSAPSGNADLLRKTTLHEKARKYTLFSEIDKLFFSIHGDITKMNVECRGVTRMVLFSNSSFLIPN